MFTYNLLNCIQSKLTLITWSYNQGLILLIKSHLELISHNHVYT
jgi:hypothetical protein